MRYFFKLVFWGLLGLGQAYAHPIDKLIDDKLPYANVSIMAKNMATGDVIYQKNADRRLMPASGTKLFTAAATLFQFDENHTFPTTLSQQGEVYYITFTGSPSLKKSELKTLLTHIKDKPKKIVLDTTRFESPNYPDGIQYDDLGWYFAAPDTAIMLDENYETYEFITGKKPGKKIKIKAKSTEHQLKLINQVVGASPEDAKHHCDLNVALLPENTLKLYGCLAVRDTPKLMMLAIPDPLYLAKNIIHSSYKDVPIELGATPKDAKPLYTIPSPSITELVQHMLLVSDNLYANALTKQLGFAVTGHGRYKEGVFAMQKILAKNTSVDFSQIKLKDGEGTRYNLVTTNQMITLLSDFYQYKNLLPCMGVSGNLQDRMKGSVLEGKVHAKTGSMQDTSSLSGYIDGAQPVVFSILINGINQPLHQVKNIEEEIVQALANSSAGVL